MFFTVRDLTSLALGVRNQTSQIPTQIQVPKWGIAVLGITVLVCMVVTLAISYTFENVIPLLAVIERSTVVADAREVFDGDGVPFSDEEHNTPLLTSEGQGSVKPMLVDDEILVTLPRPITSSLRTTISHLRARAGSFSLFRGLYIAFIWSLCHGIALTPLTLWFNHLSLTGLSRIFWDLAIDGVILVLISPVYLWWIHIVISAPSWQKISRSYMFRQALSRYKQIALPTLVWAAAQELAHFPPRLMMFLSGLDQYLLHPSLLSQSLMDPQQATRLSNLCFELSGLMLLMDFCIIIPSTVMLWRVYASLLPEDLDTIVPCDRTFGGRIIPEARGGSQRLGMSDALRSFDHASWIRLIKLYGKVCLITLSIGLVFAIVFFVEGWFVYRAVMDRLQAAALAIANAQTTNGVPLLL
ncbi:hypothetical protein MMC18_004940 [Xylographa bjoerkii]|nr:hypothetical protein [Xylographa bjoerkii]